MYQYHSSFCCGETYAHASYCTLSWIPFHQEVEILKLCKSIVEDGPDLFSLHKPSVDAPFRYICMCNLFSSIQALHGLRFCCPALLLKISSFSTPLYTFYIWSCLAATFYIITVCFARKTQDMSKTAAVVTLPPDSPPVFSTLLLCPLVQRTSCWNNNLAFSPTTFSRGYS